VNKCEYKHETSLDIAMRGSVIEEMESYDMDLFDLVVGALCKNEKKENPAGWNMMKVSK
jgi:hypothetical protein